MATAGMTVVDTVYYDRLNVSPTATALDLKRAYKLAAVQHHPDKNLNNPIATERFQEV